MNNENEIIEVLKDIREGQKLALKVQEEYISLYKEKLHEAKKYRKVHRTPKNSCKKATK